MTTSQTSDPKTTTGGSTQAASPLPVALPPAASPRRVLPLLPRLALLLVIAGTLVAFHAILMPFALAIFLAYMLYPVVRRLETLPLGRRRIPRWLAVVLIYTAMVFGGWKVLPPLAVRIASDLSGLGDTVPATFAKLRSWQAGLNTRVEELVEVSALPLATQSSLKRALAELQDGMLATPLPLPNPEEYAATAVADPASPHAESAATPVAFSLLSLQVQFAGPNQPASSSELNREDPDSSPAGNHSTALLDPVDGLESEPGPAIDHPLFDDDAKEAFWIDLDAAIATELEAQGPATGAAARLAQQTLALGVTHLGLSERDGGLQALSRVVEQKVTTAIRAEEYAGIVQGSMQTGLTKARHWAMRQLHRTTGVVAAVVAGTFDFFLVLMLAAFFLVFFPRLRDYLRDLLPPTYRGHYKAVLGRIDTRLSGAIRGQLIICFINGILTYIGLYAIGWTTAPVLAQYAAVLSVLAGVLSLIPIFGVVLSTVPMVLFALTQSVWAAVLVVAWIAIIHAIEAYLLNPNILGHNAQMNPILVVFALLAGKHVGGLVGALLAVPIAAVVVAMFGYYRRRLNRVYAAEAGVEVADDPWDD
jgi:predicted PurR-regulated permease PerM